MAATVTSFDEALRAAREMCAAARAECMLSTEAGADPSDAAIAAREAVAACDAALASGRAAMKGLGSDGDVAAAMERLTEAEAEAEAARSAADALSSRISSEAGPLARKVMQAKARALVVESSFGCPEGVLEGALEEARRTLAMAKERLVEASDMSRIAEPWKPTDVEAAAIKAHNDAIDAHGRIRRSMLARSPEARSVAAGRGVQVVVTETNPSLPSLTRHCLSVFEKISLFTKGRDAAQKALDEAEARVVELSERVVSAASYRAERTKALAEARTSVGEARRVMNAAAASSDVSPADVVAARREADAASTRHRDAARALLRARQVARTGVAVPRDGVTVHLAELERMRQQAISLAPHRAVTA